MPNLINEVLKKDAAGALVIDKQKLADVDNLTFPAAAVAVAQDTLTNSLLGLEDLQSVIGQLDTDGHKHNNMDLLNSVKDSGDGTQFLADDGTYKIIDIPEHEAPDFKETVNIETLTADKTLTAEDATVQIYTSTANRIINLPTTGLEVGHKFVFVNNNAHNNTNYYDIKQSSTINRIYSQSICTVFWDGTNWIMPEKDNVGIGYQANGSSDGAALGRGANGSSGAAVGYGANGSSSGAAVGNQANGNGNGAAVGYGANGSSSGAAVGYQANGSSDGAALGRGANGSSGAAVGYGANGSSYGAAVGMGAVASAFGAAVGRNASGSSYGAAVGNSATTNSKSYNTCTYGAYSTAERNREFVSTATQDNTNKAQLTFQKFREKDLATNAGAWQELFADASSARLVLIARSVYQFTCQINAIDTNHVVKCWELKGAVKRNSANGTSLVGTVTKTVVGADTGTDNWDVQITADDTNEAIKVEVQHDATVNVRYSLNFFATETRI